MLSGGIICYRPYEAADGWVTCGALEPKFWSALLRGGRPRGPDREAVRDSPARSRTARSRRSSRTADPRRVAGLQRRARRDDRADPRPRRGARLRAGPRARDGRSATSSRSSGEIKQLGFPIKLSRTPASIERPAPALGEHTAEVLARRGYSAEEIQALEESGAAKGTGSPRNARSRSWHERGGCEGGDSRPAEADEEMLRMGELARASGVSAATIKHYLREGLLPEPVKTSRNMAYYPAEFVERIRMIKQLQEERYMPLRVIKDLLEEDPDRAKALIELGDKPARARPRRRERAGQRRRGPPPLRRPEGRARPARGARGAHPGQAGLLADATSGSSRRSAASAPAATRSGSASPSTTRCATRRRWPTWSSRRSTC